MQQRMAMQTDGVRCFSISGQAKTWRGNLLNLLTPVVPLAYPHLLATASSSADLHRYLGCLREFERVKLLTPRWSGTGKTTSFRCSGV